MPRLPRRLNMVPTGRLLVAWAMIGCGLPDLVAADQYLGPVALQLGCPTDHLFVACFDAETILRISLPAGTVTWRAAVPAPPSGLAVSADGQRLYVTCGLPRNQVLQLNADTGQLLQSTSVGHSPVSPIISRQTDQLFVCNRFSNNVSVIELSTGHELTRINVPREPIAAALTPNEKQLVVANHLPHRHVATDYDSHVNAVVTVIDTSTFETQQVELFRGATSVRDVAVTPDGRYALVTHLLSNFENVPFRVDMGWINVNVVSVIDLAALETISAIGLDNLYTGSANPWGVACSPDGQTVWVTTAGTHELNWISMNDLVSDRARRTMSPLPGAWPVYPSLGETMWHRIPLPGKGPRTIAVSDETAYIAQYYSDSIAVISYDVPEEVTVGSIPLGPAPKLTLERKGQMLFDDATICHQNWQSCASCHPDSRADALNWDLMNDGVGNTKNTKSLLLSHKTPPVMAEGVRESAEVAVRSGMEHILFARRPDEEADAIDAYLKSLEPIPSPYLVDGELSDSARRGRTLFESRRIGCAGCHPAPLMTDMEFHHLGKTPSKYAKNQFDTPTLIEVWRTAPYGHQGQSATILELLRDKRHGLRRGVQLSEQEADDLAQYVLSL